MTVRRIFSYVPEKQHFLMLAGLLLYLLFPLTVLGGNLDILDKNFVLPYLLVPIFLYISIVDFKTYLIPDWCNLVVLFLGALYISLFVEHSVWLHLGGAALAFVLSFSVRQAFLIFTRKEALGFGDVKLFTVCGLWVGLSGVPSVIFSSSMIAIIFLLSINIFRVDKEGNNVELPFGPFICLGTWIVWWLSPIGFSYDLLY